MVARKTRPWTLAASLTIQTSLLAGAVLWSILNIDLLGPIPLRTPLPPVPRLSAIKVVDAQRGTAPSSPQQVVMQQIRPFIAPTRVPAAAVAFAANVEAPPFAGVISGAGGVQPGMMIGQEGTLADGEHPVALTGRVYVWVDATRGAIKPGDLLTTSPTPGHAMKVANPARAQGAIIGKAMTGLKAGKGLVLVLVTLQ